MTEIFVIAKCSRMPCFHNDLCYILLLDSFRNQPKQGNLKKQAFIFLLDFLILGPIYFLTRTMTKSLAVAPQPNPRNQRLKNRRQMALVAAEVAVSGLSSTATTWQKPSRTSRNRKRESSLWRRTLSRSGHYLNYIFLVLYIQGSF